MVWTSIFGEITVPHVETQKVGCIFTSHWQIMSAHAYGLCWESHFVAVLSSSNTVLGGYSSDSGKLCHMFWSEPELKKDVQNSRSLLLKRWTSTLPISGCFVTTSWLTSEHLQKETNPLQTQDKIFNYVKFHRFSQNLELRPTTGRDYVYDIRPPSHFRHCQCVHIMELSQSLLMFRSQPDLKTHVKIARLLRIKCGDPKVSTFGWFYYLLLFYVDVWWLHTRVTPNSDIFAMFTVVDTPSSVWTLINVCLCTTASEIIQPDLSAGRSVVPVINLASNVPVSDTNK